MRGANVNFQNSDYRTPLHLAIEKKLPSPILKMLLKLGANPHMEDKNGKDCCDKAVELNLYKDINIFHEQKCQKDP